MLTRRLARHIFIRKEKPYDLKAALKAVEEKHFNTRYSKEEVKYESARLRMEKISKDPLVQDYIEAEKERIQEKDSVLRSYKISKEKAKDQTVDELAQKVDGIIDKLAEAQSRFFQAQDEHEFSKRSLRMMEAARFNREVDYSDTNTVNHDYGRFDIYKGRFADLKAEVDPSAEYDRKRNEQEFTGAAIEKMLRRYGDKIDGIQTALGTPALEDRLTSDVTGTTNDMTVEEIRENRKKDYREHNSEHDFDHRQFAGYLDEGSGDIYDEDMSSSQRLSAAARLNIYKLYLEGKTIGEICTRFGILPERAKAVVFMQQHYFESVVPRLDAKTVVLGLELDTLVGTMTGTQDYGLDLDALQAHVGGNIDYGVRFDRKDMPPKDMAKHRELQADFKDILRSKKLQPQDVLVTAVSGRGQSAYLVKDVYRYKGRGAQSPGKSFLRLLRTAHIKDAITQSSQRRVAAGPRAASHSYSTN